MTTTEVNQSRPAQAAIDKLQSIPVFLIAKSETEVYLSEQNGVTVVPLYLSKKAADETLAAYKQSMPGFNASVVFFTLDKMYTLIEVFQAEYKKQSKELIFPIIVQQENTQKASEILRAEGFGDEQIRSNLAVPIFYSEPMINIDSTDGSGAKQVFFVDHASLVEAIDKLPDHVPAPKIKVANLDQVVESISKSPDTSLYEIYPTPAYFSLKRIHEAQLELDKGTFG